MPIPRPFKTQARSKVRRRTQVRQTGVRGYNFTMCDACGRKVPSKAAKMRKHEVFCPACYKKWRNF